MLAITTLATFVDDSARHRTQRRSFCFRGRRPISMGVLGVVFLLSPIVGCQSFVEDSGELSNLPPSAGHSAETTWRRVAEPAIELRPSDVTPGDTETTYGSGESTISSPIRLGSSTDEPASREMASPPNPAPRPLERMELLPYQSWETKFGALTARPRHHEARVPSSVSHDAREMQDIQQLDPQGRADRNSRGEAETQHLWDGLGSASSELPTDPGGHWSPRRDAVNPEATD